MKATELNHISFLNDGTEVVEATLITGTIPVNLPTNGAGIQGMNSNQIFAPFSTLVVIGENLFAVYIADEDGVFRQVAGKAEINSTASTDEELNVILDEGPGEGATNNE